MSGITQSTIRTQDQRIEIGLEVIKIVSRAMQDARGSGPEHIVVECAETLPNETVSEIVEERWRNHP